MTGEPHPTSLTVVPVVPVAPVVPSPVSGTAASDRPPAPAADTQAPVAVEAILDEIRLLLDKYARLDPAPREPDERLTHITKLLGIACGYVERGIPPRGPLVAVAAQAVQWAAVLEAES